MQRVSSVFILAAAAAWAVLAAGGSVHGAVDDKGMIDLFELDSVTVVYPSSPASVKERNRLSARNRASFLEGTGVEVRVVADDQVTKTDLADNILLLGWDNRLLQNRGVKPPFGRSSTSVRFIDLVRQDPDLDLMLKCGSPFTGEANPRSLFFWSRIDRSRDRFMVLPAIGSDWAIFRDYAPVAQGMLEDPDTWPPARDPIAEKLQDLDIEAYVRDRMSVATGPLEVVFNPNRVDKGTADEILRIRRRAYDQVVNLLGDPGPGFKVRLYLYKDAETKEKLTGVQAGAHSVPGAGEMHMTVRFARSSSIHEDIHPVAGRILGPTASTAAYEGLAYALEPVLMDRPLAYFAALALDEGVMPTLADLLDEERFRKIPNARRFAAAGLFMTWLREQGGLRKPEDWYSSPDPGLDRLSAMLGTGAEKLESRFRQWVTGRAAAHAPDVLFTAALAEARTHHLEGEYALAADALVRALEARPDDLQTRFNLASTWMKTGRFEQAAAELLKVLDGSKGSLRAHTFLTLGRVYDLLGRRDDALAAYRQVLELPDRHDSHLLAREGLQTPFSADRLD